MIACDKYDNLVGSFIFRYPNMSADNLGKDIGLSSEELTKVVHMESVVVLSKYRCRALQSKMLQHAENLIDKNKYRYFVATVAPNNIASIKSFEKNSYKLVREVKKYGGLQRLIYLKKV